MGTAPRVPPVSPRLAAYDALQKANQEDFLMAIQTCPTDVIVAPADLIWAFLTKPEKLALWSGTKLIDGPNRTLVLGDRVILGLGFGMRVVIDVLGMEPPQKLVLDAHLPFGVVNHEVVVVTPLDAGRCRVTLN